MLRLRGSPSPSPRSAHPSAYPPPALAPGRLSHRHDGNRSRQSTQSSCCSGLFGPAGWEAANG
eukprot:2608139-Alexandrium_andersonii.AAC.1